MADIGWLDPQEVYDEVSRICTGYNQEFGQKDTDIIDRCILAAYKRCRAKLIARGYTAEQIELWDEKQWYQRNIALCWSLKKMGFPRGDEQRWINDFCVEDELDDLNIIDSDGNDIDPANPPEEAFGIFDVEEINDDLNIELP